jgi:tetratricopeptide (TPR) repeat protein
MSSRFCWSLVSGLVLAGLGRAQQIGEEKPTLHVPARPDTRQQLDHLEAMQVYVRAVSAEHDGRLLEAVTLFEEARRLDPDAASPRRALASLYIGLERIDDAIAECRRVLEIDPEDAVTAGLLASQLRQRNQLADAVAVLTKATEVPGVKDRLDVYLHLLLDLGVICEESNDLRRAEDALRRAVEILEKPEPLIENGDATLDEIQGQAAETYEHLGRIGLKTNKIEQAVVDFRKATEKDPGRAPRLSLNLAEMYVKINKPEDALKHVDQFLRSQPQGMEAYEMKIKLLRELKREKDIVPALESAADRDSFNQALKLLLARECRKAGQAARAETIYTALVKTNPSGDAYRGLFDVFKDEGQRGVQRALQMLDDAIKTAEEKKDESQAAQARAMLSALRDDPELIKLLIPVVRARLREESKLTFQTNLLFATLAARGKQVDAAEELYRGVLDRGGFPPALETEVYVGLLEVLSRQRKHEEVIAVCKRGLEKAEATQRYLFHVEMAHAYVVLNKKTEALASADNAVNDAGDKLQMRARLSRASVLANFGERDKAEAECRALLKEYNQPGDIRTIRYALSGVYSTLNDLARSEEQLKLILDADANDASACNDLGYLWADQNRNLAEAERLIRKALDLDREQRSAGPGVKVDADQDNAAYVDSLGWVLFRKGQFADARRELERAVGLTGGTDDPVVFDHLGDACFRMDDKKGATTAWKKALELYKSGVRRQNKQQMEDLEKKLQLGKP